MSHVSVQDPVSCTSCEAEVVGRPVLHHDLPFCCPGCAGGGPCTCSYDRDQDPEADLGSLAGVRYCLDVRGLVMAGAPASPTTHSSDRRPARRERDR